MAFTGNSSDSDNSNAEDDGGDTGRGTSNSSAASAAAAVVSNIGTCDVSRAKGGSVDVVPVFSAAAVPAAAAAYSHHRSGTNSSSTTSADLSLTSPHGTSFPGPIVAPFKFSTNTPSMVNTNPGCDGAAGKSNISPGRCGG